MSFRVHVSYPRHPCLGAYTSASIATWCDARDLAISRMDEGCRVWIEEVRE